MIVPLVSNWEVVMPWNLVIGSTRMGMATNGNQSIVTAMESTMMKRLERNASRVAVFAKNIGLHICMVGRTVYK